MEHTASLAAMTRHWGQVQPDAPALTVPDSRSLTFGELHRRSSRLANALRDAAVGPGDRVAFLGTDASTWALTWVGASKLGAAGVPLNWRLSTAELDGVLADAAPGVVVCEARYLSLLGRQATGDGAAFVLVGDAEPVEFESWFADRSDADPGHEPRPEEISFLIYTSGTSGRPKGVQLSNGNIAANLASPAPWQIGPGDVVFVPAPLFHLSGSGWVFLCLALGAHSLFVREFQPAGVLRLFEQQHVTHALMVPAMVQMLVRDPVAAEVDFSALRMVIYGGSPISATVMREAQQVFGCELVQSYGMTETCGPITFLGPDDHRSEALLSSAGRAVPGVEVAIFDPQTEEQLAAGQTGEVWTRSDLVMAGYRNMPDEQAAVVRPDGWLRTGDAGHFDEAGYLYLTDRVKDMIVSGGENIYPVEVENVLMDHPAVADVAVIGVPDERWGETVLGVIVARGEQPDPQELITYCRGRLAHYKCPTRIEFVEELPRNPGGKVLKRALRAKHWAGSTRSVG